MQVSIRYFAITRDRVGLESEEVEVSDGATVADLWMDLEVRHPTLAPLRPYLRLAVNREFAADDVRLRGGDVVALIPPVAGGSGVPMAEISDAPLDADAVIARVERPEAGAVVTFRGIVRNHAEGRAVLTLEYEAYTEMAVAKLEQVRLAVQGAHPECLIAVVHRVGVLEVGDLAVVIAVSSAHRQDAFAACLATIDQIKETVPIWKKEVGPEGASWVGITD